MLYSLSGKLKLLPRVVACDSESRPLGSIFAVRKALKRSFRRANRVVLRFSVSYFCNKMIHPRIEFIKAAYSKVSPVLLAKDPEQPCEGIIRPRPRRALARPMRSPLPLRPTRNQLTGHVFKLRTPESIRKRRQSIGLPVISSFN
jgi:hypothetical protein